jgi:hypothetical protein
MLYTTDLRIDAVVVANHRAHRIDVDRAAEVQASSSSVALPFVAYAARSAKW